MSGDLMFVTATNTLAKAWRNVPEGKIGFGAAGRGNNALFAPRFSGAVGIVIEDMIIRAPVTEVDFWMDVSDILILNEFEQVVCPGEILVDTVLLFDPINHLKTTQSEVTVIVSPNPVSEILQLQCPEMVMTELEVYASNGERLVQHAFPPSYQYSYPCSALPDGLYFIKIKTQHGTVLRRIVKK